MARLLHTDHHVSDLCADLRGDVDCNGKHHHHHDDDCGCPDRHPHKLIPIAQVTIDCTPVSFETPGQAKTILFC